MDTLRLSVLTPHSYANGCRCRECLGTVTALCECGCGSPAPISDRTIRKRGIVKGEPLRYINGHQRRGARGERTWMVEDRGHPTPCWIWGGPLTREGYGQDYFCGANRLAHRVAWELAHGPVPEGKQLDHLCRQRACVNPDHLEPVTSAENTRRGELAKLSEDIAEFIRSTDESTRVLAERFGVDPSTIFRVRSGERWIPCG